MTGLRRKVKPPARTVLEYTSRALPRRGAQKKELVPKIHHEVYNSVMRNKKKKEKETKTMAAAHERRAAPQSPGHVNHSEMSRLVRSKDGEHFEA